jgi:NAD(P)-dependent dehydrogenase (short-subunit alcohol dehydrogenase family)
MLRGYRDRVAVVTGAANGLGRALAKELATRGCHLALIDTDDSTLPKLREELALAGVVVTHHSADVGSEPALLRVAAEIGSTHGTVHLVINNTAVSASAAFANTGTTEFERITRVNFLGAVHGCRAFLTLLQSIQARYTRRWFATGSPILSSGADGKSNF